MKNLVFDPKTGEIVTMDKKLLFDENKLREEKKLEGYYVIATNECKKNRCRDARYLQGLMAN